RQMEEFFERLGAAREQRRKEFFVEARYPYQVWELEVPLARGVFDSEEDVQALVESFHAVHERVFAVSEPGQHVECIYWKGRATVTLPRPLPARGDADGAAAPVARERRPADFDEQAIDTPRYYADDLAAGHRLDGPAIVEEPTTTV